MEWKIEYYSEGVRKEINSLPLLCLTKFVRIVDRLCQYGPDSQRMPNMRHLRDSLWEIRAVAADGSARIFYCCRKHDSFVMLHCFMKKSQETPKHELDKALRRMKEVQNGR